MSPYPPTPDSNSDPNPFGNPHGRPESPKSMTTTGVQVPMGKLWRILKALVGAGRGRP